MSAAGSTARTDAKLTWARCRAMPSAASRTSPAAAVAAEMMIGSQADRVSVPDRRPHTQPTRHSTRAYSPMIPLAWRRDVQAEPGREAPDRADRRAVGHAQRGHHHEHQVGHAATGQPQPVDEGELEDAARRPAAPRTGGTGACSAPRLRGRGGAAGRGDPLAPGVTVTVTVGVGLTCGLGGRTENRGLCRGASITMPTIPSAVKSAYGVTVARAVSAPARLLIELMKPTGTPGTYGWSMHRRRGDQLLPRPEHRVGVQHLERERPGAAARLARPGDPADLAAGRELDADGRGRAVASSTVQVPGHRRDLADQPLAVQHRLARPDAVPAAASSVTVCWKPWPLAITLAATIR